MMQSRLEERLEQGRSRDSQLVAAKEETLRLEQENVRLRLRSGLGYRENFLFQNDIFVILQLSLT